MTERTLRSIYLIGIGGSAMAPLAGMLAERGYRVTGSDVAVYPPASTLLEKLGVRWKEGFREEKAPTPDLRSSGRSRGIPKLSSSRSQDPHRSLLSTAEIFLPGLVPRHHRHTGTTTAAILS
jgi:UDP-N-acetylmuramate: L-alanyl-gamma-D-glutamyl-meso-diaminopimelate ligase